MAKGDPAAQPIDYPTLSPIEIRTHGLNGFQPILAQRLPVDRIESQPSGNSAPAPRMAQLELLPQGYRLATIRISDAAFEDLDLVLLYRFNARDFELHGCGVYSSTDVESSGAWVQAYRSMVQLQIGSAEEVIHGKLGGSFLLGSKVIHVDPAVEFLIPRPDGGAD